ncbi:MAG TPA: hypothetical protein PLB71_12005, partial [Methanoculleus sp.]|uniref:hypothetical protein n=1 Tax=Methanoculleus sp. TaxID=90427 RepID=UPI002B7A2666
LLREGAGEERRRRWRGGGAGRSAWVSLAAGAGRGGRRQKRAGILRRRVGRVGVPERSTDILL